MRLAFLPKKGGRFPVLLVAPYPTRGPALALCRRAQAASRVQAANQHRHRVCPPGEAELMIGRAQSGISSVWYFEVLHLAVDTCAVGALTRTRQTAGGRPLLEYAANGAGALAAAEPRWRSRRVSASPSASFQRAEKLLPPCRWHGRST